MIEHSFPFGDLPAPSKGDGVAASVSGGIEPEAGARRDSIDDDDVIRIDDLAPREDVTGGRKLVGGAQ
jgi:hypothetical protein